MIDTRCVCEPPSHYSLIRGKCYTPVGQAAKSAGRFASAVSQRSTYTTASALLPAIKKLEMRRETGLALHITFDAFEPVAKVSHE
jgi:hypothetical protein